MTASPMTTGPAAPAAAPTAQPGSAAGRVAAMLGRELRLGPRSPVVLLAIVMPLLMTFLVATVFGGLLESQPRLGIASPDPTAMTEMDVDGVQIQSYASEDALRQDVADHELDAGLILP